MITESEIKSLPMSEKMRVMEWLWSDLSQDEDSFESPQWHRTELEKTEARRQAGLEEPMDWDEAKRRLLD